MIAGTLQYHGGKREAVGNHTERGMKVKRYTLIGRGWVDWGGEIVNNINGNSVNIVKSINAIYLEKKSE